MFDQAKRTRNLSSVDENILGHLLIIVNVLFGMSSILKNYKMAKNQTHRKFKQ